MPTAEAPCTLHRAVMVFPPSLSKADRAMLHKMGERLGLVSESQVGQASFDHHWWSTRPRYLCKVASEQQVASK